MASVPTVLALVTLSGEEELLAKSAHDGLVELPLDEFVAVHFEHVALALSDGTLATKSFVRSTTASHRVLDYVSSAGFRV
jgi:hypothetical protein